MRRRNLCHVDTLGCKLLHVQARYIHGCSFFYRKTPTSGLEVVAAGGYTEDRSMSTMVEVYNIKLLTKRKASPLNLGYTPSRAVAQFSDHFVLFGGYHHDTTLFYKQIYKFDPESETFQLLSHQLSQARNYMAVALVPDTFLI